MNIKIDKTQRDEIISRKMGQEVLFGSHLYKTATETSDVDVLYFYKDFENNFGIPYNHCFQYDEGNVQELWVGVNQFWYLLQKGDNTIFPEYILFSSGYDTTQKMEICRTYNILKCFSGYIRRDLKNGSDKRIKHAKRGLFILNELLNNDLPTIKGFIHFSKAFTGDLTKLSDKLRVDLGVKFQNNEMPSFYVPKIGNNLHQLLLDSNNIKEFKY